MPADCIQVNTTRLRGTRRSGESPPAFTIVELLAVMTIIALLMGILLPTLGVVRQKARRQQVVGQLTNLGMAIDAYHTQFEAFPGPVPDTPSRFGATIDGAKPPGDGTNTVSSSESLTFGLLGCVAHGSQTTLRRFYAHNLSRHTDSAATTLVDGPFTKVPHRDDLGQPRPPRRLDAFYNPSERELGDLDDDGREEIVDVAQARLPILYYRANRASKVLYAGGTDDEDDAARSAYDYRQNEEYRLYNDSVPNQRRLVAQLWDWRRSPSENITDDQTGELKTGLQFSQVENFDLQEKGEPTLRAERYVLMAAGEDGRYANCAGAFDAGNYVRPKDADVTDVEKDNVANIR